MDKRLSFKISNTGGVIGSEVPQVYIERDNVKRLKAFKRVFLDNQEFKFYKYLWYKTLIIYSIIVL